MRRKILHHRCKIGKMPTSWQDCCLKYRIQLHHISHVKVCSLMLHSGLYLELLFIRCVFLQYDARGWSETLYLSNCLTASQLKAHRDSYLRQCLAVVHRVCMHSRNRRTCGCNPQPAGDLPAKAERVRKE